MGDPDKLECTVARDNASFTGQKSSMFYLSKSLDMIKVEDKVGV